MGKDLRIFIEQKKRNNWELIQPPFETNNQRPYITIRAHFLRFAFGDSSESQLCNQLDMIKSENNFLPNDASFELEYNIAINYSHGINLISCFTLDNIMLYNLHQPFVYKAYTNLECKIDYEENGVLPSFYAEYSDHLEEITFSATIGMFISGYWKKYFNPIATKFKGKNIRIITYID